MAIDQEKIGFNMVWKKFDEPITKVLSDELLSDWLEAPVAYGAYEGERFIGFVEGFLETWNNRFRITNICIFDNASRNVGIGTKLLNKIMEVVRRIA